MQQKNQTSMPTNQIRSNIVPQAITRDVQRQALKIIADAVALSFGPSGSTTAITKYNDQAMSTVSVSHTKDGHTIIKNLQFVNPIERSVQDLVTDMTRHIVKEIGDGTTSCAILASNLFNALCTVVFDNPMCPSDIIQQFSRRIKEINKRILKRGWECTLENVYDICMISTNGNVEITKTLYEIYKKYGIGVYIDVGVSPESVNVVKEYEGMTLETGYADMCFINDRSTGSARVSKPHVYFFQDPIDTPEMLRFLDIILKKNIMDPMKTVFSGRPSSPQQAEMEHEVIPTVIICKKITPDASSFLETVVKVMNQRPGTVPLIVVSDIHQEYLFEDISQMCGARVIKKYLDPVIQKQDQDAGLAPTEDNITEFYGSCEEVRSDQYKTQFIRPAKMYNEDGTPSETYNMMLNYLSGRIEKAKAEGAGINEVATTKRRYNAFKGNMVDFLIGGVTLSDRDALKASVEDAVLNVRSAVTHGVGYGGNFMAFSVIKDMLDEPNWHNDIVLKMLYRAYYNMIKVLYENSFPGQFDEIVKNLFANGCPLNIRTNEYDKKVLSSIESDVVILNTIDKILTLMYTTNQYLLPSPAIPVYDNWVIADSQKKSVFDDMVSNNNAN